MVNKEVAYICNYYRNVVYEEPEGVDFYPVDDLSGISKATCSEICAQNLKLKIIEGYQKKINEINNQKIEKLKW